MSPSRDLALSVRSGRRKFSGGVGAACEAAGAAGGGDMGTAGVVCEDGADDPVGAARVGGAIISGIGSRLAAA